MHGTLNIKLHKARNQNHPMLHYSSMHGYGTYKVSNGWYLQEGYFKNNERNDILCGNHISSDEGHFSKSRLILWLRAAWPEVDSRLPWIFLPPYPVLLAHPPFSEKGSRTLSLTINYPAIKLKSGLKMCGSVAWLSPTLWFLTLQSPVVAVFSPLVQHKKFYFLLTEGCGLQKEEPSLPYTDLFFNGDSVFAVQYELILITCLNSQHSRNAPYSSSP